MEQVIRGVYGSEGVRLPFGYRDVFGFEDGDSAPPRVTSSRW